MKKEQIELSLWKEIAGLNMSVSHDRWHIDRVLAFTYELQKIHGGDIDVLTAAALMHDLGRADEQRAHGEASRQASVEQAEKILDDINFPGEKRGAVLTAILEHDQPDLTPSTIEGRILKDADFLAGFGAWGILRIALWSGESGRNISTLFQRLTEKMPKRLENVEFPESLYYGRKEMLFTNLFLHELDQKPTLSKQQDTGFYIILEGISGSGKGTQAELLKEKFEEQGFTVEIVSEPDEYYRVFRDGWQKEYGDLDHPMVMKYLLMADRYQHMQKTALPALENGKVVISDRSFISTLVYQCDDDYEVALTAFEHRFTRLPDLLILFDIDSQTAWDRIEKRDKTAGLHEKPELLSLHREQYLNICQQLFAQQLKIIDASQSVSIIANKVWTTIQKQKSLSAIHL